MVEYFCMTERIDEDFFNMYFPVSKNPNYIDLKKHLSMYRLDKKYDISLFQIEEEMAVELCSNTITINNRKLDEVFDIAIDIEAICNILHPYILHDALLNGGIISFKKK